MGIGVGEAALAPAGYSLLSDSFPRDKLVRATSIFALGGLLGGGIAFFIGGQIIDYVFSAETAPFGLSGLNPGRRPSFSLACPE